MAKYGPIKSAAIQINGKWVTQDLESVNIKIDEERVYKLYDGKDYTATVRWTWDEMIGMWHVECIDEDSPA